MLTLEKRVTNLTYNEEERNAVNRQLITIQEREQIPFSSPKDMLSKLLSLAIKSEITEPQKTENIEITDSNNEFNEITVEFNELKTKLDEFRSIHALDAEMSYSEIIDSMVEFTKKSPEIKEVEKEVIKEVPVQLKSNQILVTLKDEPKRPIEKKLGILDEIHRRRASKMNVIETREELIEKLLFNDGTIFNLHGECYTGFHY